MFSEGQSLYLQEVLGVTPGDLIRLAPVIPADHIAPTSESVAVVVFAGEMAPEERELLARILGSVKLSPPLIVESFETQSAEQAQNILLFAGHAPGREGRIWQFPKLSEMLGSGADVNAKKKLTWTLLQQLVKEL